MIPRRHIISWRQNAPWADDSEVEQDLILSRAMIEIFKNIFLSTQLVMRGGTAFNKLILSSPARYSEDIDLVIREEGPIGPVIDAIREVLDPWLGEPRRDRSSGSLTIIYRFESGSVPVRSMRLKIEINLHEHLAVLPLQHMIFAVDNPWFSGETLVPVYHVNELFGKKLRALYQRKKGRDLFDLWLALDMGLLDPHSVLKCFRRYTEHSDTPISRAQFEANLSLKRNIPEFHADVLPLLVTGIEYDPEIAMRLVLRDLVSQLPGNPWKGDESGRLTS